MSRLRVAPGGTTALSVALHPAEIGSVQITASLAHGTLNVTVACADQAARDAVSAALPALHQALNATAAQNSAAVNLGFATAAAPGTQQTGPQAAQPPAGGQQATGQQAGQQQTGQHQAAGQQSQHGQPGDQSRNPNQQSGSGWAPDGRAGTPVGNQPVESVADRSSPVRPRPSHNAALDRLL
jgi:flagellar hook-length control protein FliK